MALQTFVLQPSADIHLLLQAGHTTVQVEARGFDDSAVNAIGLITSQCTFAIASTAIATISGTGLLTAVAEGVTYLTVTQAAANLELVARVSVHKKLDALLLGNKSGTVHLGSDDFQPTIYGDVQNGDIEDVSGHPYIKYTSLATANFTVDAATGRVMGVTVGTGKLRIEDTVNAVVVGEIDIVVKPGFTSDRQIAEPVTLKGYGPEKRNILFLGEGFSASATDEKKFRKIVSSLDYRMRVNPYHEPYKLLSNDYNTWLAFEASATSGISIGHLMSFNSNIDFQFAIVNVKPATDTNFTLHDLIKIVGIPTADQRFNLTMAQAVILWTPLPGFSAVKLEQRIFDAWQNSINSVRTMDKDTTYGLIYGNRLGDRFAGNIGKVKADHSWYLAMNDPFDFISRDMRRMSSIQFAGRLFFDTIVKTRHWTNSFFEYFGSLKVKKGIGSTDPRFHIGRKWDINGDDQGMVIIIVNDERFAANYHDLPNCFGNVTIGYSNAIGFDSFTQTGMQVEDHTPATGSAFIEPISATVIHELSHSINLGDEYENTRNGANSTLGSPATQLFDVVDVELEHNLNSTTQIQSNGPKWERSYFRIEKSSAFVKDAVNGTAANTIEIELFPGEGKKWKTGESAFLLTKNLNSEAVTGLYPKSRAHAINGAQVSISSKTGDKLVVSGTTITATAVFPKGSMIFIPQLIGGNATKILLPGVIDMLNNGKGLVTGTTLHVIDPTKIIGNKPDCSITNHGMVATPNPIPHVKMPSKIHQLLVMYQGGGTFNCGVVRPTPVCKMRSEYFNGHGHVRFCHLCKYVIVHEFNPSKHVDLDQDYPGSHVP